MNKVIFWDFQDTLAHNDWMISKALYKVLLHNEPNTKITIEEHKATDFAKQSHIELAKPDGFKLYDDTIEILSYFKLNGWKNIILSNHIPELPYIVESLGLKKYISGCISSANVGFEKPNIKIYEYALHLAKYPEKAWIVGDSFTADVKGPGKVGIKGVLVRSSELDNIEHYSKNLLDLKDIIN